MQASHYIDVCVENVGDSAISATNTQQSFSSVQVQLTEETKPAEAAKLSTEFLAEVIAVMFLCDIYCGLCDGFTNVCFCWQWSVFAIVVEVYFLVATLKPAKSGSNE